MKARALAPEGCWKASPVAGKKKAGTKVGPGIELAGCPDKVVSRWQCFSVSKLQSFEVSVFSREDFRNFPDSP
jgi:hypothetical protein